MTEADLKAKSAQRKKESFDQFMANPQTRFMLSVLPAGESREALAVILEACFNAGFNAGSGDMAVTFLEHMMKDAKR